jgi:acetyl-CoA carboxylase carboxyl transferase subunit alpha
MLEHAIYTVASPEASASILWRDSTRAEDAATAMKVTAQHLHQLGVIDEIIEEPVGGAHRAPEVAIAHAGEAIARALESLRPLSRDEVRRQRREKFLAMGRSVAPD